MWLGPARVIAQDGKVIFIRHGSYLIRVTPNRVYKCTPNHEKHEHSEEISVSGKSKEGYSDVEETQEKNNIDHSESVVVESTESESHSCDNAGNTESSESKAVEVPRRSLRLMNKEHGWTIHDVFVVQFPKH